MSDLFMRLALRALGDAASSMRVESEPDSVFGDSDETEVGAPEVGPAGSVGVLGGPGPLAAPDERPSRKGEREEATPNVPPSAPLMPMPSIVPAAVARIEAPSPLAPVFARTETVAPAASASPPPGLTRSDPSFRPAVPAIEASAPALVRPTAGNLVAAPTPPVPASRPAPATPIVVGPTVEVTIGRVEVRVRPPAAVQADRVRPEPTPAPALSLEEYLRRREASS